MNSRMPLMLRVFLSVIVLVAIVSAGMAVWGLWAVFQAGPEGIGRSIGAIVRGYNEAVR